MQAAGIEPTSPRSIPEGTTTTAVTSTNSVTPAIPAIAIQPRGLPFVLHNWGKGIMLSVTEHSTVCDVALTVQATKDCMLFGLISSLYTYAPNNARKK